MTLLVTNYTTDIITAGRNSSLFNKDQAITAGEIDSDYLTIKTAASIINMSENEADTLIEEIRSELPINKDE